jgi:hypothetical protein
MRFQFDGRSHEGHRRVVVTSYAPFERDCRAERGAHVALLTSSGGRNLINFFVNKEATQNDFHRWLVQKFHYDNGVTNRVTVL